MKSPTLTIDLGSSNTKIYQLGAGIVLAEPSVIAINETARGKIKAIGADAKSLIGKTVDGTVVSSPVFEGYIYDSKTAVLMIENFLNKVTLKRLGKRPSVLFAVPCGADNASIKKFESVLNESDVFSIHFVESPVLAALGAGVHLTESTPCFIIDIGGGTTNIATVSLGGVISGISVNIGGKSLDNMLIDFIEQNFELKIGRLTAEKLKIQIASLLEKDNTTTVVNGRDLLTGKPRAVTVASNEIYPVVKTFFDKIFELAGMVMSKLPAEISADIRRSGVYFTGGTSNIIGLEEYFRFNMGIRANVCEEPAFAVALGGGIVSGNEKLLARLRINRK
ncbi:MAG: rod shape-determining protein [Clostridia bacterium]|nr:rod shape-determining protein [Clostridia bacterium]